MEDMLPAREVAVREFNSLRGRLCTVIESAGLPTKQERALVTLIKNLSYQNQAVIAELIERLEDAYEKQETLAGNASSGLFFRYVENKLED
jgi:hypothetical protein